MKERRRPDWPVTVLKYDITLLSKIPESFWITAKNMQNAWNELVELREQFFRNTPENATKEQKKLLWADWPRQAKNIVHDPKWNFGWECKAELIDRFNKATLKGQHPKKQFGLKKLSLVRIFGAGGRTPSELFSRNKSAVGLKKVDQSLYLDEKFSTRHARGSKGYWELAKDERVDFILNLHRPIPPDCFIKRAMFKGTKNRLGWKWSLILLIEIPPSNIQTILPDKTAGLDLGWRKMGDYIRIGVLADSTGKIEEIKLPLNYSNSESRRRVKKWGETDPDPIISDRLELENLRAKIGSKVEQIKNVIKAKMISFRCTPVAVQELLSGLTKMRERGLIKLLAALEEYKFEPELSVLLKNWRIENARLENRYQQGHDRYIARRRLLYRSISKRLSESYKSIAWEKDLALKEMSEAKLSIVENAALKNSMHYRQIVCLHEFRDYLKHATTRSKANLVEIKAKGTTSNCCFCNAPIENGAKLVGTCSNGHSVDQDYNAAINLLKSADPSVDLCKFQWCLLDQETKARRNKAA